MLLLSSTVVDRSIQYDSLTTAYVCASRLDPNVVAHFIRQSVFVCNRTTLIPLTAKIKCSCFPPTLVLLSCANVTVSLFLLQPVGVHISIKNKRKITFHETKPVNCFTETEAPVPSY